MGTRRTWLLILGAVALSAVAGCGYRERELVQLADKLCGQLNAPTMCAMLHARIATLQTWETEADLGLALFVAISLLAFATGGGGVVTASQGDRPTAAERTKRFAKYGAAGATLVGILTVIQNTLLPADFGTMSALAKRGKRQLEGILSVLDGPLPIADAKQRSDLIATITSDCDKFDELEKQIKHEKVASLPVANVYAFEKAVPWDDLASDPDRLCFLGLGVSNTLAEARQAAFFTAKSRTFDFITAEMMKERASVKSAQAAAGFVTEAGREASTSTASRYDFVGKLYQTYSRFCVGRAAASEGLAALYESSGNTDPMVRRGIETLKKSTGLSARYYESLSQVYAASYGQAQKVLQPEQLQSLLEAKAAVMTGHEDGECRNLQRLGPDAERCFLYWDLLATACRETDPETAERAFSNAIRINDAEQIGDVVVAGRYADFLKNRGRNEEAKRVLRDARRLSPEDPWISWLSAELGVEGSASS